MADDSAGDGKPSPSPPPPPPPPCEFSVGELVLSEHSGQLYDAKVNKVEFRNQEWRFFIHYQGWNKNWDEWVTTARLKKYTLKNSKISDGSNKSKNSEKRAKGGQTLQNRLKPSKFDFAADNSDKKEGCESKIYDEKKDSVDGIGCFDSTTNRKGSPASQTKPNPPTNAEIDKGGTRKIPDKPKTSNVNEINDELDLPAVQDKSITHDVHSADMKTDENGLQHPGDSGEVQKHSFVAKGIKPTEKLAELDHFSALIEQLVDDKEIITESGKLVKLPRNPNVCQILEKYLDYRAKKHRLTDRERDIFKRLCKFFDKVLRTKLLYGEERQQYQQAIKDNVSPSTVYGAEHLLRLFDPPRNLLKTIDEKENSTLVQQNLHDFLKYLDENQHLFLCPYIGSDEEHSV